jgi:hypothetical protein
MRHRRKHRRKNRIRQMVLWLVLFIIGSLIVNFLVSPNSFDNFKDNAKSLFPKNIEPIEEINNNPIKDIKDTKIINEDNIQVKQQEYKEIQVTSAFEMDSCSVIEALADQNGVSANSNKERLCTYYCGESDMGYGYFKCITDKFHCYCKN